MRIIHTSDWHLGQYFINKSRLKEHQRFMAWLLEQVDEHQVDAIVVAGDIFDTGSPPSYARKLYNQFIVDLQQHNCQLVILGGNHDSVATLNESTNLLACLNTYVVPSAQQDSQLQLEQQVITLKQDISGNNRAGCVLCAIPFIRPRDVLFSQAGQSADDKQQDLQQAIYEHYNQIFQLALTEAQKHQPPLPIVATGHLTCVGASSSDSVREIYIGTLGAYPANRLPNADYIALGHIHQSQKVGGNDHIRYCGSPIPLSFDEVGNSKVVNLVELSSFEQSVNITSIPVPVFQPMKQIKGDLESIEQQLLSLSHFDKDLPVWLDIEVASSEYVTEFQTQIETWCKELPVEVLLLRKAKAKQSHDETTGQFDFNQQSTLTELNPIEVFEKRLDAELVVALNDGQKQAQLHDKSQADNTNDMHLSRLKRIRQSFAQMVALSEAQINPLKQSQQPHISDGEQ